MFVRCIGTGSSGNSYALMNDKEILLLDLGVKALEIKKAIDFRISDVVGAVVSHSHLDHSKAVADFEKMGIDVWKPYIEYAEFSSHRIYRKVFGKFFVQCFPLPHNGTDDFGFLIEVNGQKILYLTDFEYCPYVFARQKVNHIICECNYQQKLVDRNLPQYEHKIRGHCSLETCNGFIKANVTDSLQTVILCHLGQETTEPVECVAEVQKIVPQANVDYARAGFEIELRDKNKCPF